MERRTWGDLSSTYYSCRSSMLSLIAMVFSSPQNEPRVAFEMGDARDGANVHCRSWLMLSRILAKSRTSFTQEICRFCIIRPILTSSIGSFVKLWV